MSPQADAAQSTKSCWGLTQFDRVLQDKALKKKERYDFAYERIMQSLDCRFRSPVLSVCIKVKLVKGPKRLLNKLNTQMHLNKCSVGDKYLMTIVNVTTSLL